MKVAAGTNHNAPSDKTCVVTASFISTTLNDNSWAVIRAVSDAGQGSNYWSVGDAKQITISGTIGRLNNVNLDTWVFIIGFNHNSMFEEFEGFKKIHFQIGRTSQNYSTTNSIALVDSGFGSTSSASGAFAMNPASSNASSTNFGGWKSSALRTTVLGSDKDPNDPTADTFLAALPSELRAVIKPCTKSTDNFGGGTNNAENVTASLDSLFLLSEYELFGARAYANLGEQNYQQQYAFYATGNSKTKYKHSATGDYASTWLRSPSATSSTHFCASLLAATPTPFASDNYSRYCFGIAPAFCV